MYNYYPRQESSIYLTLQDAITYNIVTLIIDRLRHIRVFSNVYTQLKDGRHKDDYVNFSFIKIVLTESDCFLIVLVLSLSVGFVFSPDYLKVATAVVFCVMMVILLPMHQYSVDMFSYSSPLGIWGSGGARGVIIVALSISSHEQTQ